MSEKETEEHCCNTMRSYLNDPYNEYELVQYNADVRSYRFPLYCDGKYDKVQQLLFYCPWCGKKLPNELAEEWDDILETQYGLSENDRLDDSKLPEDFKTDAWWKKRGL